MCQDIYRCEYADEVVGCIVGAVVHVHAQSSASVCSTSVRQALLGCEGVEIHAEDEQSRLVITMEADTSKAVLKLTESIQQMEGVILVTPVYQHSEDYKREEGHEEESGGWRWR